MNAPQLGQIVGSVDWDEVEFALVRLYPDAEDSLEGYHKVFAKLRDLAPTANMMRIAIQMTFRPEIDDAPFLEVVGRDGSLNRDQPDFPHLGKPVDSPFALAETEFALELHPWSEWLGMAVDALTLIEHDRPEIVAHCLHEMTFFGFDEKTVEAQRAEIERRADAVRAMSDEERNRTSVPLEQVMARIKSQLPPSN